MINDDCTVLVCSCDKYADVVGPFAALYRKYWSDCPFETVLVTETDFGQTGFDRTIACGCGLNWCEMLVMALGVHEPVFRMSTLLLSTTLLVAVFVSVTCILAAFLEPVAKVRM